MLQDNRDNYRKGNISAAGDLDEIYRDICGNFGWGITKAKAFTKSNQGITLSGIVRLCQRFKLRMEFDVFKDEFTVYFQDKDKAPCEYPDQEPEVINIEEENTEEDLPPFDLTGEPEEAKSEELEEHQDPLPAPDRDDSEDEPEGDPPNDDDPF